MVVKALAPARGFRWRKVLDEGVHATIEDLAKAKGVASSYLSRVLRFTLLAPEIVETILDGRQPAATTAFRPARCHPHDASGAALDGILMPGRSAPSRSLMQPVAPVPAPGDAPETGEATCSISSSSPLGIGSFALLAGYAALCGRL